MTWKTSTQDTQAQSHALLARIGLASLLAMAAVLPLAAASAAGPADFDQAVAPFFAEHCLRCHDAKVAKSDFRMDTLSRKIGLENTPQWVEIMERINSSEMPPKKEKQPGAAERARVVAWLAARLKEGESARMAARGPVSYNRLTRDEYVNTIRDLLGVEFDAKDPGNFLEDPEWHGFERIGSVLTLSPSNIEKYLGAGEKILAEAYPEVLPPKKGAKPGEPFGGTKRAIEEHQIPERHRERLQELGLLDKVRYDMWPGDIFRYSELKEPLPEAGVYEISYTLSGLKPEKGLAPRLKVYEAKLDRVLFEQDIVAPEDKPVTVTFRAHLPKGRPSIDVYNAVPGPSNLPRSGRHGDTPFVSTKMGRIPWQLKLTDEAGKPRYPFLILDSISWRGPIVTDAEKQRRAEYFPASEGDLAQVREGLGRLARRAFRRPATDAELDHFTGIVKSELAVKEKFPNAVKAGMLAILCSKSFLFITEGDVNAPRATLNDWEIAARLSYLLWNSMPDDPLFQLAEQGRLRDRAELSRQVARMLKDPRAAQFADAFATQWLRLRKVGMFPPDKKLYPDYDKALEAGMIGESKAFFQEVLGQNLSLREFFHSDWTMLNARLAGFYGLPDAGLPRDAFQRVSLTAESRRGGLLTQAAILSLTSDGTRHRPVHRGVWLSEVIFGKTPPPPPPNVDPIPTTPVDSPKATLRMKLEAHIKDPNCAACHSRIDPLGLAFENYDAVGRWRTEELTDGKGANPKVNPAGQLADGRSYATAEDFKKLLLADVDTFAAAFLEKLATYGLRRAMDFGDRADLQSLATASKAKDHRLRDLVEAFVCSDLFQKR